jgi:hypothetical protein
VAAPARRASPESRIGLPAVNAVLCGGFLVVALLSLPWLRPLGFLYTEDRWPIAGVRLPVAAADYLATLPATRLYNTMDWGGYLAWRLAPRQQIFIDGRFQPYPPRVYDDYFAIAAAQPGWDERLDAYGVDALVIDPQDAPALKRAVDGDAAWAVVYCDDHAAIYLPRAQAAGRAAPGEC